MIDKATAEYYAALYDAEVRCLDMRLEAFFADRPGSIDLSANHEDLTLGPAHRLSELRWQPVAAIHDEPIDQELEDQLRTPGYVD